MGKNYTTWGFLDVMDKNMLYDFANTVDGSKTCLFRDSNFAGSLTEDKEYYRSEMQKRQGYYLMWFVYRHVLGCDTLERQRNMQQKKFCDSIAFGISSGTVRCM